MDPLRDEPPQDRRPSDEELAEVGEQLRRAAESSVPLLLAPGDRMLKVRRRVRRNRRIRAAVLVSPVVALAAAVPLLLPAAGPTGSGPAAGGLGTPSGSPAAAGPGFRTVPLTEAAPGFQVTAPTGWQTMLPRDPDGTPVGPGVYLSSEPAAPGKGEPCVGTLSGDELEGRNRCLPVAELPPHQGVLVYWVRYGLSGPKTPGATQLQRVAPNDVCRRIGGTTALTRTYTTPSGNAGVMTAYACLAAPDDSLVNEVATVLDSVRPLGSSR